MGNNTTTTTVYLVYKLARGNMIPFHVFADYDAAKAFLKCMKNCDSAVQQDWGMRPVFADLTMHEPRPTV